MRKKLDGNEFKELLKVLKDNKAHAEKSLARAKKQPTWGKARAYYEGVMGAFDSAIYWLENK